MMSLILPPEVVEIFLAALKSAGRHEIGGILMGEHIGLNEFKVTNVTVHRRGGIASFVRCIEDAIGKLRLFFRRTEHDYQRFNYLGEWHSHPLFEPIPSIKDDESMFEIVKDDSVGANFAVLLILKLDSSRHLIGTAHTYMPDGKKVNSTILFGATDRAEYEQ
jgi:proteasome lid subunit RPN8/RPN11